MVTILGASTSRHAEVAGAGLAGLTVATALAQRGWSVRVHERSHALREIGAGIFIWSNGLRALQAIGAYEEATAKAERITRLELRDERGRVLQGEWLLPDADPAPLFTIVRNDLHAALVASARRAGVEIVTSSGAAAATPGGELVLESGERLPADIVLGADGVDSRVRDSLGLAQRVVDLRDGCSRHLIARRDTDPRGFPVEHWNGGRRIGIVPSSPDLVYVFLCCPVGDARGRAVPIDRNSWKVSFPRWAQTIDRLEDDGVYATFRDVVCERWSSGSVALVGDAAHAMSPNRRAPCSTFARCSFAGRGARRTYGRVSTGPRTTFPRTSNAIPNRWPAPLTQEDDQLEPSHCPAIKTSASEVSSGPLEPWGRSREPPAGRSPADGSSWTTMISRGRDLDCTPGSWTVTDRK